MRAKVQRYERIRNEDADGEFFHLVTLWRATREERILYEENS